jgi:hypothetical protein
MAYLSSTDVVRQSIRLGLAGSWAQQIPELEEHLDAIRQQCPKLVNSFIPLTERDLLEANTGAADENDEEGDGPVTAQIVTETDRHVSVSLTRKGVVGTFFTVSPAVILWTLPLGHPFSRAIRNARHEDYNLVNVVGLSRKRLRWYKRLAVTNAVDRCRWVFNDGDFMVVRDTSVRFVQCFRSVIISSHYCSSLQSWWNLLWMTNREPFSTQCWT